MTAAPSEFETALREAEPDLWLSSRFIADPAARADVALIYALNHELVSVAHKVREPLIGQMRLTWWRDSLDALAQGGPHRGHPLLIAIAGSGLSIASLADLPEGRLADFDSAPADAAMRLKQIDETEGVLMGLVARRLAPETEPSSVRAAARAWALSRQSEADPAAVRAQLRIARAELKALPIAAFPAVAHVALAGAYARGAAPGDFEKRVRVTWAVTTGRVG